MENLLFITACLLTAVGGCFLLAFGVIHVVTDHRLLLKMLRGEQVDMKYDEEKYDKLRFMFNFVEKNRYIIKIGLRRRSRLESFFRRWGKLCMWAAILLWLLEYNNITDGWGYLVVILAAFVIEYALSLVLFLIMAAITSRLGLRACKKYGQQ